MPNGSDDDEAGSSEGRDGIEYGLDDWSRDPLADEEHPSESASVFGTTGTGSVAFPTIGDDRLVWSVVAGAVVGAVLSVPFSVIGTAFGGALAGNLRGDGERTGAKTGAMAGVLSTIPGALLELGTGSVGQSVIAVLIGESAGGVDLLFGVLLWVFVVVIGGVVAGAIGAFGGYAGGQTDPVFDPTRLSSGSEPNE